MLEKMNRRRWIAVGLSIVVMVLYSLSTGLSQMINREDQVEKLTANFQELMAEEGLGEKVLEAGSSDKRIAVLPVEGTIINMATSYPGLTEGYQHAQFIDSLYAATEDDTVKGILLKVNSPGGGVYESAEIHHHIEEIKKLSDKPIWTFMGNMAASGGYYISAPTDHIIASPETLTGSIGVIMSHTDYQELYGKLGLKEEPFKSAPMKDIGAGYRDMTEEERALMQGLVDGMYSRFIDVVAQGRGLTRDQALALGDGRIFDGYQALEAGLVDEIGFYDEALGRFESELGIKDPEVFQYTSSPLSSLFPLMNLRFGGDLEASLFKKSIDQLQGQGPRPLYLYGGE
ncbi:MAG: signal peptide peptidase SppA [Tissierellia bacterium]|nr:signal peptide peptidase SppA [Tissierellia bacterium]